MNKEEIKKAGQVMIDHANGKQTQIKITQGVAENFEEYVETFWSDEDNPDWNWEQEQYRTKPELKYKPYEFTIKNFNKLLGSIVLNKNPDDNSHYLINSINISDSVTPLTIAKIKSFHISLQTLFEDYTFEDGLPCGELIKEEGNEVY